MPANAGGFHPAPRHIKATIFAFQSRNYATRRRSERALEAHAPDAWHQPFDSLLAHLLVLPRLAVVAGLNAGAARPHLWELRAHHRTFLRASIFQTFLPAASGTLMPGYAQRAQPADHLAHDRVQPRGRGCAVPGLGPPAASAGRVAYGMQSLRCCPDRRLHPAADGRRVARTPDVAGHDG